MTTDVRDIPADTVVELTPELDRAFRALDCVPMCHCCMKRIEVGQKFKLAYVRRLGIFGDGASTDEMLCYHCTPTKLIAAERRRRAEQQRRSGGGYTRQHGDGDIAMLSLLAFICFLLFYGEPDLWDRLIGLLDHHLHELRVNWRVGDG